jgi:hypothetical protein
MADISEKKLTIGKGLNKKEKKTNMDRFLKSAMVVGKDIHELNKSGRFYLKLKTPKKKKIGEDGVTGNTGIVGSIINKNYNGVNESIANIIKEKINHKLEETKKNIAHSMYESGLPPEETTSQKVSAFAKRHNLKTTSEPSGSGSGLPPEETTSQKVEKFRQTHNLSATHKKDDGGDFGPVASAKVGADISKAMLAAGGGSKKNIQELSKKLFRQKLDRD